MKAILPGILGVICVILSAAAAFSNYPEYHILTAILCGAGCATIIMAHTFVGPLEYLIGKALVMANVTGAGGATGSVTVQDIAANVDVDCTSWVSFNYPSHESGLANQNKYFLLFHDIRDQFGILRRIHNLKHQFRGNLIAEV